MVMPLLLIVLRSDTWRFVTFVRRIGGICWQIELLFDFVWLVRFRQASALAVRAAARVRFVQLLGRVLAVAALLLDVRILSGR